MCVCVHGLFCLFVFCCCVYCLFPYSILRSYIDSYIVCVSECGVFVVMLLCFACVCPRLDFINELKLEYEKNKFCMFNLLRVHISICCKVCIEMLNAVLIAVWRYRHCVFVCILLNYLRVHEMQ